MKTENVYVKVQLTIPKIKVVYGKSSKVVEPRVVVDEFEYDIVSRTKNTQIVQQEIVDTSTSGNKAHVIVKLGIHTNRDIAEIMNNLACRFVFHDTKEHILDSSIVQYGYNCDDF